LPFCSPSPPSLVGLPDTRTSTRLFGVMKPLTPVNRVDPNRHAAHPVADEEREQSGALGHQDRTAAAAGSARSTRARCCRWLDRWSGRHPRARGQPASWRSGAASASIRVPTGIGLSATTTGTVCPSRSAGPSRTASAAPTGSDRPAPRTALPERWTTRNMIPGLCILPPYPPPHGPTSVCVNKRQTGRRNRFPSPIPIRLET